MLLSRRVFDAIGLWDPRYLQLQDYDLIIRALLAGFNLKVIQEPLYYYRILARY